MRWERGNNGVIDVLILTENKIEILPTGMEVKGKWTIEPNRKVYLAQPTKMRQISPGFEKYPNDAEYLMVSYYKERGKNVFISPRGFKK